MAVDCFEKLESLLGIDHFIDNETGKIVRFSLQDKIVYSIRDEGVSLKEYPNDPVFQYSV